MKIEAANIIAEFNGEVREDYSGRGMFGKQTAGIVVDSLQDFFSAIADIMQECISDQDMESGDLVIEALRNIKSDNMGNGYIFY